jgi:signal peptidase I
VYETDFLSLEKFMATSGLKQDAQILSSVFWVIVALAVFDSPSIKLAFLVFVLLASALNHKVHRFSREKGINDKLFGTLFLVGLLGLWATTLTGHIVETGYKRIVGEGMEPSIHHGSLAIISPESDFERGDVVVYSPSASREKTGWIVGLSNEEFAVVRGKVFIDRKPILEPYRTSDATFNLDPIQIPVQSYIVLLDKYRPNAGDSSSVGPISKVQINGKITSLYDPRHLTIKAYLVAVTGMMLIVALMGTQIYAYLQMTTRSSFRWLLFFSTQLFILIVAVVIFRAFGSVEDATIANLCLMPIALLLNVSAAANSLFVSSPIAQFAVILTTIFGWIGGIFSIVEINRKLRGRRKNASITR